MINESRIEKHFKKDLFDAENILNFSTVTNCGTSLKTKSSIAKDI